MKTENSIKYVTGFCCKDYLLAVGDPEGRLVQNKNQSTYAWGFLFSLPFESKVYSVTDYDPEVGSLLNQSQPLQGVVIFYFLDHVNANHTWREIKKPNTFVFGFCWPGGSKPRIVTNN